MKDCKTVKELKLFYFVAAKITQIFLLFFTMFHQIYKNKESPNKE